MSEEDEEENKEETSKKKQPAEKRRRKGGEKATTEIWSKLQQIHQVNQKKSVQMMKKAKVREWRKRKISPEKLVDSRKKKQQTTTWSEMELWRRRRCNFHEKVMRKLEISRPEEINEEDHLRLLVWMEMKTGVKKRCCSKKRMMVGFEGERRRW